MWKIALKREMCSNWNSNLMDNRKMEEIIFALHNRAESSEKESRALREMIGNLNESVLSLNMKINALEENKNALELEVKYLKSEYEKPNREVSGEEKGKILTAHQIPIRNGAWFHQENLNCFYLFMCFCHGLELGLFGWRLNAMINEQKLFRSEMEELKRESEKSAANVEKKIKDGLLEKKVTSQLIGENETGICKFATFDPSFVANWKIVPYKGGPDVLEWAKIFENHISLIEGANEEQKLKILRFYLEGLARDLVDSKKPSTLEEAINILIKFFNKTAKDNANDELNSCHQKFGENIFDYAERLNNCLRKCMNGKSEDFIKSELLERFMDGIKDDLKISLSGEDPQTFEEAYQRANWINFLNEKQIKRRSANSVNEVKKERKVRICYFCRKPGHFINTCPEKSEKEKAVNCSSRNYYGSPRKEQIRPNYDRHENFRRDRNYSIENYHHNGSSRREKTRSYDNHETSKRRDRVFSRVSYHPRDTSFWTSDVYRPNRRTKVPSNEDEIDNWRKPSYKDESRKYIEMPMVEPGSRTTWPKDQGHCDFMVW
jgi:hypothetical protein